jgi:diguanylate cyclase (GGDEF)-like protein/PAS domain S-box-containing protein
MIDIKNFLLSGFEFTKDEYELRLQFILLNTILSIIVLMLALLGSIRYFSGEYVQAYIDFGAAFSSLIAIIAARYSKKSIQFTIPFLLSVFYFLITFTFRNIGIIGTTWYIVLILAAFFLKGKKVGLFFSAISIVAILFLESISRNTYTLFEYIYITIPILMSMIFLYLYEQRNEILNKLLKKQKESLELEVQRKTQTLSDLLRKSQELASIMQNSQVEIYIVDFESDIYLYANNGATMELGYTADEITEMNFYDINTSVLTSTVEHFKKTMLQQNNAMNISMHKRKDGSSYGVQSFMHKIYFDNKDAYVVFDIKISNVQQAQKEILKQKEALSYQAHYDLLTKLPNRFLFYDRLSHAIVKAKRKEKKCAILFVDLDHFKEINDTYGHEVGDHVLIEVAKRLQSCVRESDTVARLAGDEFLILIEDFDSKESIATIAKLLVEAMQIPIKLKDKVLHITCSIGISIYPNDSDDAQTLVKYADHAMYQAKSIGKNNFKFYT